VVYALENIVRDGRKEYGEVSRRQIDKEDKKTVEGAEVYERSHNAVRGKPLKEDKIDMEEYQRENKPFEGIPVEYTDELRERELVFADKVFLP
jgi:hypothetical protein